MPHNISLFFCLPLSIYHVGFPPTTPSPLTHTLILIISSSSIFSIISYLPFYENLSLSLMNLTDSIFGSRRPEENSLDLNNFPDDYSRDGKQVLEDSSSGNKPFLISKHHIQAWNLHLTIHVNIICTTHGSL